MFGHSSNDSHLTETCICMYIQRGSGTHPRNGRDPAVDQEVCPDHVRRIVRREVNCQLRDFQRIGHPLAWIVGSEDVMTARLVCTAHAASAVVFVAEAWMSTKIRGESFGRPS